MKNASKLILVALMAAFTLPAMARDHDGNPPGPRGGPGTNWENPVGPYGGPGASPDRHRSGHYNLDRHHQHYKHHQFLIGFMTDREWGVFRTLRLADRYAFCDKHNIRRGDCWYDNPPGANPDLRRYGHYNLDRHHPYYKHHQFLIGFMTDREWVVFRTLRLVERYAFCDKHNIRRGDCWYDRDDNPPGPRGGPGVGTDRR